MAEKTKCFFPETSLGMVVTGAATTLLPRIVGLHRARSMILLGEKIDASDAFEMGLVWRVCKEASPFDEVQALGEKIAKPPERGVRDSKRLLNNSDSLGIEEAVRLEVDAVVPAFVDPETARRVASFKE
jgi:enoyl-CoA hydratase/carnithine racemase